MTLSFGATKLEDRDLHHFSTEVFMRMTILVLLMIVGSLGVYAESLNAVQAGQFQTEWTHKEPDLRLAAPGIAPGEPHGLVTPGANIYSCR
jgi:hypothetical protein